MNQNKYMLTEAVSRFLFNCEFEKNLSLKTIKAYKIDINQFKKFLKQQNIGNNISEISRDDIKGYIKSLSHFRPKTIKRKTATIKALFGYIEFEEDEFVNPFRKIRLKIKEPMDLPSVMSFVEIKKIYQIAYKRKDSHENKASYYYKEIVRDIAILELLFVTGVRVSELCNIKKKDIDLKTGDLIINGKGDKSRIIQICNKEAISALKEYITEFSQRINKTDYFFINRQNKKISEQSVRIMTKKYAKAANLKKHITPHTFRHTFATLLLEADVDIKYIQHMLGHSTIMTTQIYTHVNKQKQKRILATKHPRKNFSMTT